MSFFIFPPVRMAADYFADLWAAKQSKEAFEKAATTFLERKNILKTINGRPVQEITGQLNTELRQFIRNTCLVNPERVMLVRRSNLSSYKGERMCCAGSLKCGYIIISNEIFNQMQVKLTDLHKGLIAHEVHHLMKGDSFEEGRMKASSRVFWKSMACYAVSIFGLGALLYKRWVIPHPRWISIPAPLRFSQSSLVVYTVGESIGKAVGRAALRQVCYQREFNANRWAASVLPAFRLPFIEDARQFLEESTKSTKEANELLEKYRQNPSALKAEDVARAKQLLADFTPPVYFNPYPHSGDMVQDLQKTDPLLEVQDSGEPCSLCAADSLC